MLKQIFMVTLEVPAPFDQHFPRIEAERMPNIIRGGVIAKSYSFVGPVPFTIRCERDDEVASASGEMREYSLELFEESEEAVPRLVKTT